jgi:hypothetical protein
MGVWEWAVPSQSQKTNGQMDRPGPRRQLSLVARTMGHRPKLFDR